MNIHLLRCPHPTHRALWQTLLTINLKNFYHTSNTAQPVRALISQALLLQWQHTPGRPYRLPRTHTLSQAAQHQQDIGWQHFLSGRIAKSLIQYQEQYYCWARERPHTEIGRTWIKKLLQQIWGHFFAIWKSHCEARHEVDTDRISKQHKHQVQARVRACYAQIDQLPADTLT
jgi:hypothetical protein